MKKIALLMTVFNRKDITLRCLRQIHDLKYDQRQYLLECFLTDDGSTDGTSLAIRKEYSQVHIYHGDGNLFWNRGMLAAWQEALKTGYDYYLWLNDDTFLYDDVIMRLLESSKTHADKAIIVGSTSAVGNPKEITYGGWVDGKVIKDVTEEHRCQTFNGNIVLIPESVRLALGTNDPYYRHSLGDMDYGWRATEAGIEIWQAKGIMGECDRHERPATWADATQPFSKRWRNFFSPTGNNPFEFFYFRKKHFGLYPACRTFVTNYIRLFFPSFWRKY